MFSFNDTDLSQETWTEQAILTTPTLVDMGFSLAVYGDTIVAGAPLESQPDAGSAGVSPSHLWTLYVCHLDYTMCMV